jgi:hypothetical protein
MIRAFLRREVVAAGPSLHALRTLLPLLLFAFLLGPGCRKEELFTEDGGISLEFSQDSVLFDTVFTTVGTVTKRFTARNPNNRAVRVDIALEGGSSSPYRINVDGIPGTDFTNVEILGGDSVFVFVEATLGPGGVNTPFVLTDHVLFNTNGTEQRVLLEAWGQDAHFIRPTDFLNGLPPFSYVAGGFDENGQQVCGEVVTWTNDKPYVIYGYAVVDSCNALIIEEGVRVYVHNGGGLWVYRGGQVTMNGTIANPIVFQGDRREELYAELPGQWDRIWINEGPEGTRNLLRNVLVKNALVGIQCETWPLVPDLPTSSNTLVLDNVRIRNCSAAGILSRNYRITSYNLLVGDCGQYAVALTGGGQYDFWHTTVANFWNYEVRQTPSFYLTNAYQDAFGTVQVRAIENSFFRNGIIHGNIEREFELGFNALAQPAVRFEHMLLRTDVATSDPAYFDATTVWRNTDPGFVDAAGRDFRLAAGAFARNRGASSPVEALTDLRGDSRNCDGGGFDLGCYEYCP